MKSGRNILLALPWYNYEIHRGVAHYAREHNWHLNASMCYSDIPPKHWYGDGAVTQLFEFNQESHIQRFIKSLDCPCVVVGHHIGNDNIAIAQLAADYLKQRGFHNFAIYLPAAHLNQKRFVAFKQQVRDISNLFFTYAMPKHIDSWDERQKWLKKKLRDAPNHLAIFAIDDDYAAEILEAALSLGIRVPENMAVLGVHNDELICEALRVPLSSVDNNLYGVGYEAAQLLDRYLDGEPWPEKPVAIPPLGVVTRRSTDTLAVEHPEVLKAVGFIRTHYHKRLRVCDIVAATAMSERGLYKAFHKYMNTSISEELEQTRLRQAQKLLLETDKKIIAIASESGFGNSYNMFYAFKRNFGVGPKVWREQHCPAVIK